MNNEIIGEVVSGILSPSLDNTPIGFVKVDEQVRLDYELTFVDKTEKTTLKGKVVDIPFLELTSRRKIIDFL